VDRVYVSVDARAAAMRAQLAALAGAAEFLLWVRANPAFKPRLSGVRHVTVLLDTGATPCFICARPAAVGPDRAMLCGDGCCRGAAGLGMPVLVHLRLGDAFRDSLSVSPMDMDVGDDLILGWDWISSHDLRHLPGGTGGSSFWVGAASVSPPVLCSPPTGDPLQGDRAWGAPPPPSSARQRRPPTNPAAPPPAVPAVTPGQVAPGRWHGRALHRRTMRSSLRSMREAGGPRAPSPRRAWPGGAPPRWPVRVDGVEVLRDGTEQHLTSS
jgi:hypothetical protein